jgi:predicted house-cleaning noncanonical NTP pyrophosphatase (MazG superfamily)
MQELIHFTVQKIKEFLEHFNEVQALYLSKSFDFDARLDVFLNEVLEYFRTKGNTSHESEVLKIMNMISTVKRGFNPIKMEKIITGRRELLGGFSFNGMESMYDILMEIYTKENKKLDDAEELISGIIVSLYQNGILDDEKLKDMNSVPKIERFWTSLVEQNTAISGINKKLRLTIIPEDIFLILEKVFLKLI